ncbi:Rep1 [Hyposoter didymator ichnovirus]|nr:Rep1 [Hyposoter didymator ichnovirus]
MCESLRTIVKSLRKWVPSWRTSREPSPPPSASTYLPCDVLLHMSRYLQFEDYRNLIEAFWPDGGEDELIRQRLWKLSSRIYSTSFFNGKPLQVEYNHDTQRPRQYRILLNVKTLLPITGPIFSSDMDEVWISPLELSDIVWVCYTMDKCSEYRYANCDCCARLYNKTAEYPETFGELCGTDCPYGHFHHYCTHHISWWLMNYLLPSIQVQETKRTLPRPLPERRNTFVNTLLTCWCISAGAESVGVPDSFTSTINSSTINEIGSGANS